MRYFVLLVFVLFYSCGDSGSNRGCTDYYAYNYDEFATYDDGSCLYIICNDPWSMCFPFGVGQLLH